MWPLVSIEIKGERGLLAEAILQNAHTGAVMVSNLLELKRRAGVDIPYGYADVFTISMDKFSLLISAHWAVLNDLGETEYMHKTVRRWFVRDADLGIFTEARRAVRNSIETHLDAMRSVIISDLERVRERDLQAEAERQAETEAEKETVGVGACRRGPFANRLTSHLPLPWENSRPLQRKKRPQRPQQTARKGG